MQGMTMSLPHTVDTDHGPNGEQRWFVKDGQRPLSFMGWQLASANSQTGADVRWTELTLYITTSRKYVLEKIGRSDVFHREECSRRSKGKRYTSLREAIPEDAQPNETLEELFIKCDDCQPTHDLAPVFVERDIYSVATHDSPAALVDSLYRKDRADARYLSRVARQLLDKASAVDEGIRRVLEAPADIT